MIMILMIISQQREHQAEVAEIKECDNSHKKLVQMFKNIIKKNIFIVTKTSQITILTDLH